MTARWRLAVQSLIVRAFGFRETLAAPLVWQTIVEALGSAVLAAGAVSRPVSDTVAEERDHRTRGIRRGSAVR